MKVIKGSRKGILLKAYKREVCAWMRSRTLANYRRRHVRLQQVIKIAKKLFPECFDCNK